MENNQNSSSGSTTGGQPQRTGRGSNLTYEARSKGGQNSKGNFKNDPQRAAIAGKKGGEASGSRNTNQ